MPIQKFVRELKRRNVYRVAIVYSITAWLLAQMAGLAASSFEAPSWVIKIIIVLLLIGFPIAVILAWAFEISPQGIIRTSSVQSEENPYPDRWKKPFTDNVLIGILILLLIVQYAYFNYWNQEKYHEGETSLGIIPFRNISGNKTYDYFGLGMASEIRTKLSLSKKFKNLSSVQAAAIFANTDLTPSQIGDRLNVDFLVMGMYQISDMDIKVTAELVDARTGRSMEGMPPYQNSFNQIFDIQSAIADRVLSKFSFFQQDSHKIDSYSPDLMAFGHVVKGNQILSSDWSAETTERSMVHFEQAVEIDSGYLSAWSGLMNAKTSLLFGFHSGDSTLLADINRDMEFIETHFPESWEKNLVRGFYHYHGLKNYRKAQEVIERVLEVNPENGHANETIASIYKRTLDHQKAIYHLTKTKQQNPNDITPWTEIAIVEENLGDYKSALSSLKHACELGASSFAIAKLIDLVKNLGDMSLMPERWQKAYSAEVQFNSNYLDQNWSVCLNLIDTVQKWHYWNYDDILYLKAKIHYLNQAMDSSTYYARSIVDFYKNNPAHYQPILKAYALSMLGQHNESNDLVRSGVYYYGRWAPYREGDALHASVIMTQQIDNYVLQEDYISATSTWIGMRETYPDYSDLIQFKTDPFYNRIKKEHPPFLKAIEQISFTQE